MIEAIINFLFGMFASDIPKGRGSHNPKSPHKRNGHYRSQKYGPGLSKTRKVYVHGSDVKRG